MLDIFFADIDAHDEYGKTPLHCAVGAQKLDIVQRLLRYKPDVDAHDDRDDTALHTAVRTGNLDIVLVSVIQVKSTLVLRTGGTRTWVLGFGEGLGSSAGRCDGVVTGYLPFSL